MITEIKKGQIGKGLLIENDGFISMNSKENKPILESIFDKTNGTKNIPNPFVVSAVFQKFGIENANGRIYPENILKPAVEKYMSAVKDRRGYGEANHPDLSSIDLDRIALNIVELHWEGSTLVGKMEIPITDGFRNLGIVSNCADNLAHWLLSGLKIGVSSRGLGNVTKQFDKLIVSDYEIVCWDAVTQPSTPDAYIGFNEDEIKPYIESVEYSQDKKVIKEIKENKFSKFNEWLCLKD